MILITCMYTFIFHDDFFFLRGFRVPIIWNRRFTSTFLCMHRPALAFYKCMRANCVSSRFLYQTGGGGEAGIVFKKTNFFSFKQKVFTRKKEKRKSNYDYAYSYYYYYYFCKFVNLAKS